MVILHDYFHRIRIIFSEWPTWVSPRVSQRRGIKRKQRQLHTDDDYNAMQCICTTMMIAMQMHDDDGNAMQCNCTMMMEMQCNAIAQ